MPERFRLEIEDEFIADLSCAVCTAPALRAIHLPEYADYVSCEACGSSFVVEEEGERVVYGEISEQYSDTAKVVLKNWVTLSVVGRLASAERERKGIARPEVPDSMTPPWEDILATERADEVVEAPIERPSHMGQAEGIALEQPSDAVPPAGFQAKESPPVAGDKAEVTSLPLGERYRVRIKGDRVYFPKPACAHCLSSPASSGITINGSLPIGDDRERRRRAIFRLPLCAECRRKSTALSAAQKNGRVQAHLTAMLVGLALFVAALGLGVVDLSRNMTVGLLLLGLVAGVGYLLPLGLLLPRARRAPPLRETYMIGTTLRVRIPEEKVAESFFDFRNPGYAQLFWESNSKAAVAPVEELIIQTDAPTPDK